MYNIIWGFGKKKYTQTASFFIEDLGNGQTQTKLNVFLAETKVRGMMQTGFSDGKRLMIEAPYLEIYNILDSEVELRKSRPTK